MEAPNKIYLEQTGEVTFNAMWFDKPTDKGFQHEYIRKDLLLAWAKQKQYESTTIVADNFWQEVIDKISSM